MSTLHKIDELQFSPQKAPASLQIPTALIIKSYFLYCHIYTDLSHLKSRAILYERGTQFLSLIINLRIWSQLLSIASFSVGFCLPQVAPVTYLRMSSQPKLYTAQGRTLSAFPLGMSLTFVVQFYNSIGEKFHTHNTQLYLALNRYGSQ